MSRNYLTIICQRFESLLGRLFLRPAMNYNVVISSVSKSKRSLISSKRSKRFKRSKRYSQ